MSGFLLLDGVAGWRAAKRDRIDVLRDGGDLRLQSIPGTLSAFAAAGHPGVMALGGGRLFIADRKSARIAVLEEGRATIVPGLGGRGHGARNITDCRGLAVYPDGSFAVSDPANRRVQIFSPFPHALLRLIALRRPWGVALDRRELLHIVDRADKRVVRIRRDGTALAPLGEDALQDPTAIALSPSGRIAVVDGNRMVILGESPIAVENLSAITFDDEENLYAGTSDGLIWKYGPDGEAIGVAASGQDGAIRQLLFDKSLLALAGDAILRADTAGAFVAVGTYVTEVLDSRIESCEWHRVSIEGSIPPGSSIEVTAETSDDRNALDAQFSRQQTHLLGGNDPDCLLLTTPGQFMRLRLVIRSAATSSPRIHAIRVQFPRQSYLQYLPAIYQEDPESRDFLARFLSIFQTSFDGLDLRIDELWHLFDPMSVPRQFLPWLAAWQAMPIDPDWTVEKTRQVLMRVFTDSRRRGTPAGIEQSIADYARVKASVVEHFKLRRWMQLGAEARLNLAGGGTGTRLWSRAFYDRMQLETWSRIGYFRLPGGPEPAVEPADWGANEFSVFYLTNPYDAAEAGKRVARVVEREKPAHTSASLCAVMPRFRVGVQATVGVDSVVGDVNQLVIGSLATLGHDSILACSHSEHTARAAGGVLRPRAGVSTRLL